MNANKIEGEILLDNDQTSYDLWSRMVADKEATYVQNGCSRDENVDVDVW